MKNNLIQLSFAVNIWSKELSHEGKRVCFGMLFRGEFLTLLTNEKAGDYYTCLSRFGLGYVDSYLIDDENAI